MDFLTNLIQAFLMNILLAVIAFVAFTIAIKIKKANWFNAIDFHQTFIAFSFSLYVFALLPIYISILVWIGMYFLLRDIVFRKDETRKYQLYSKLRKGNNPFPRIRKISQFKEAFFKVKRSTIRYNDFKYSFISYSNTGLCLIVLWFFKVAEMSHTINILYFIEAIIISSMIFIFIARLEYHLALTAPISPSYLCEWGSYVSVIFVGLIYYGAIIAILVTIHGTTLFSF